MEPRTELIEGLIVQKKQTGNASNLVVRLVFWALQARLGEGFDLSMRTSLPLDEESMPEPDVLVLRGTPRDYDGHDPDPASDVVLVVEASVTTLPYDRTTKATLYARHEVRDFWIVDLMGRRVEVRRKPLGEG